MGWVDVLVFEEVGSFVMGWDLKVGYCDKGYIEVGFEAMG